MNSRSFLWVIPKWTLPATDGARVATERLLSNLVKEGAIIDVLCLGLEGEVICANTMKEKWGVRDIFYFARPMPKNKFEKFLFYLKELIGHPFIPLTMASFNKPEVRAFVSNVMQGKSYDYLFLDGLHLAIPFIKNGEFEVPLNVESVIYRAHNIEQDIWRKAYRTKRNPLLKLLLFYQYLLVKKVESLILQSVKLVVPISQEDSDWIKCHVPEAKTHVALMGMDFSHPIAPCVDDIHQFLFLGRLDWPPNRDGLKWFLDEVWPFVDTKKAHLHIGGSGDATWLNNYSKLHGVTMHGFVSNVDDLYAKTHVSLIPIFYGSGTRIKVIESYTKARAIISTKMGAQGSNLIEDVDYINAETKAQWISAINGLDVKKLSSFVEGAREKLQLRFDERNVAKELYSKL
jgi:polysaccharide biosynthesis protein PslH